MDFYARRHKQTPSSNSLRISFEKSPMRKSPPFQAEVAHQAELEALQEADRVLRQELEQVSAANQLDIIFFYSRFGKISPTCCQILTTLTRKPANILDFIKLRA